MGKITRGLLFALSIFFLTVPRAPAQTTVPLCQFYIFYNADLEAMPGANETIVGNVQCNSNIWLFPNLGVTQTFSNNVTASGWITNSYIPGDPDHSGTPGTTVFDGEHVGGVNSSTLAIGTNNTGSNVYGILQIPPASESPTSAMGTNRFYNLADTVLLISNSAVTAIQESTNGAGFNIPTNTWQRFLNTNVYFWNGRENIQIQADMINVSNLVSWANAATNALPSGLAPNTIFIADERTLSYTSNYYTTNPIHHIVLTNTINVTLEPGILLYNGAELPHSGLTVASPNPIYIWGNYNTTTNRVAFSQGVNSTTNTYPASVLGDAITILSSAWNTNSAENSSAATTTVNAALVGGIVPTTAASYSGGVENFPRLLENWAGNTFWFNGSMVCLFTSETATNPWAVNGSSAYYNPPIRHWAYDNNFTNLNKLPPHMPMVTPPQVISSILLSSSSNPAPPGSSITFTSTVTALPASLGTPTGTVEFFVNASTSFLALANGIATYTTNASSLKHGTNYIKGYYLGSGYNFPPSSNSIVQIVDTPPVVSPCTASALENTPLILAAASLLTNATDADGDPLSITNTLSHSTDGGPIVLSANDSTLTYTPPTNFVGGDIICYFVNDTYTNVPGLIYVSINNPDQTITSLISSTNFALPGSNVTFTASVQSKGGSTPTGLLAFRTNGVAAGYSPVTLVNGMAIYATASLPHGSNYVTAEYAEYGTFLGSTGSVVQIVDTPPVVNPITVSVLENNGFVLATASLLTNATDADGDPLSITNVLSFSTNGGTVVLSTNDSTITYTPMPGYVGNDEITYYVNDPYTNVAGEIYVSVSNPYRETAVFLNSPYYLVPPNSNVTFSASVQPVLSGLGVPTGLVTFRINGVAAENGVVPVTNDYYVASFANYTTASLPHGSNYVTAEYAGNGTFFASTGSVVQIIDIPPAPGSFSASVPENSSLTLAAAKLLANATDADGDPLNVSFVTTTSTNGGTVVLSGDQSTITYTPVANFTGNDAIYYDVNDTLMNVPSNINVSVTSTNTQPQNVPTATTNASGTTTLTAAGVPGYTYHIQAATSMAPPVPWVDLSGSSTTAPANGVWTYTDPYASNYATRFYRTVSP